MIGETVSHYRILEELGRGAMGVVYKAQDTRLKRVVALKFLPPAFTRDEEAKRRFVQEAEAASALDNPHVCTIHDIDSTPDGRVFIAMSYYEGETLKQRIQRGALPVDEALSIATQIARGLAAAHAGGIVHRDIKPANIILTSRGEVKIVDFGIAKLSGQTDLTGTGVSLGTIAYMAPEQFEGRVDPRTDLWALGVVLHEMLTGRRPFNGDTDLVVMNAILMKPPPPIRELRPEVPDALADLLGGALQKDPAHRCASAAEMVAALDSVAHPVTLRSDAGGAWRVLRRPAIVLPAVALFSVLAYFLATTLVRQSRTQWAREQAIPEITRLLQQDDYEGAYALARQAEEHIPNDPVLADLWRQITQSPTLRTEPAGAAVRVKPYAAATAAEWQPIGTTPLQGIALPRGAYRWRIEHADRTPIEFARNVGDLVTAPSLPLVDAPPGMVSVPASRGPVDITGFATEEGVAIPPFAIDRTEVTNRQFKEFVDAGGYRRREFWKHQIEHAGRQLSWDEAMALFRDSTGQPGPATWELGDPPAGRIEHPVNGVSWYEAAAYAEFRGASLPTIYHWARAALGFTRAAPIRGLIVEASNFDGNGPVAVASTGALGPYGTYDMAGNVREWCWNASGNNRWILGGAWNDFPHMYVVPYSLPPSDRSATNGFRLARYTSGAVAATLTAPIEVFRRDFRTVKPASDELFDVFKRQLAYSPVPPEPKIESVDESNPDWILQRVTIDSGHGERMPLNVYVPKTGGGRRQVVVYFPGLTQFLSQSSSQNPGPLPFDFVTRSGRIFVAPVFKGSFERFDGFVTLTGEKYLQTFRQRMREWRQETGQLLDYLAARPDVDADRIAYSGVSFGASVTLPILAVEPRFKAAVMQLAGLSYRLMLPEVDAVNFAPRITQPVLMLEARYDHLFPVDQSQEPLFALLGTPADRKRMVLFDAGHGPLPRGQVIKETLAWLDRYLGAPQ